MADLSLDLRRRVVRAYHEGLTATYEATAELFGIGRATVSRLLRLERETGDVLPKKRGGDRRRSVDLDWLRQHAEANPDRTRPVSGHLASSIQFSGSNPPGERSPRQFDPVFRIEPVR